MSFKISECKAQLKNVNIRSENNGEDKVLACDLKIEANVPAADMASILDKPILAASHDKDGDPQSDVEMTYRSQIDNVVISIDGKEFEECRVKRNMKIAPSHGHRFTITLTAQVSPAGDIRYFGSRLHDVISFACAESQLHLGLDAA